MILKPQENTEYSLDEVKQRIKELTEEFEVLFDMDGSEVTQRDRFTEINYELAELKKRQETISSQLRNNQVIQDKVNRFATAVEQMDHTLTKWDEELIRQMIHTVEVISTDRIRVVMTDRTVVFQEVYNH